MKILLVEDNDYKIEQLLAFLTEEFKDFEIVIKKSYHSAIKELRLNNEYRLILLDISMPTYDIQQGEPGGDPIPLAGKLILNEMFLRDIAAPVIVVTMYENFVDGTQLVSLDRQLKEDFSSNYVGYVYFSPGDTSWKEALRKKILEAI